MDNQGRSDYKYIWDLVSNVMVKVSAIRPLTVLKKKRSRHRSMCVDSESEVNAKEILNQSICPPFFALPEKRETQDCRVLEQGGTESF